MAKAFDARSFIFVPAEGHPKNAEYRVAWGDEKWNFEEGVREVTVTKAQMVYDGNVAGMLSPSFLDGTQDELAVQTAMKLLKQGKYGTNSKTNKDVVVVKHVKSPEMLDMVRMHAQVQLTDMNRRIFQKRMKEKPSVKVQLQETFPLVNADEPNLHVFVFRVEIVAERN